MRMRSDGAGWLLLLLLLRLLLLLLLNLNIWRHLSRFAVSFAASCVSTRWAMPNGGPPSQPPAVVERGAQTEALQQQVSLLCPFCLSLLC